MTVYAIFCTFVLGGVSSIVVLYSYLAWQDGKELKLLEEKERQRHAALLLDQHYRNDDQEQSAVDLVQREFNGTILSTEKR